MADTRLQELFKMGTTRNPIQEDEFKKLLGGQGLSVEDVGPGGGGVGFDFASAAQQKQQQQQRQQFNQRLRGEEQEFLGRFRTEFPTVLSGIEEQLNLPGLREQAFQTTEDVRAIPGQLEQSTQGTGITESQLRAKIAGQQAERLPLAQEAVREAQFAEEEFGRRAQRELVPFETEINMMKDRFSREATGFNQDAEAQLNLLLQQIQQEGARDLAKIQQATQLAQLEQENDQFKQTLDASTSTVDLGDRIALIDPFGNEISSFSKGLAPTRGTSGGSTFFASEPPDAPPSAVPGSVRSGATPGLETLWEQAFGG